MMFLGCSFTNFEVDWLAYEYWSECADEPYWNFPCFRNASYHSWRDQLLHSTDYGKVYEAAAEMQEILLYECPIIICYENELTFAYRTDKFEGYVIDVINDVFGWWTNYKVHLKSSMGGLFGGTFRLGNLLGVDTFNFMTTSSAYSRSVLNQLYDSLMVSGPDGRNVLWLAESYIAQTHADDPAVQEGHTRFIFDMIQNATWTDGVPMMAEDVAYSLNYYHDGTGNPYGADLINMTAAYARSAYQVVVEFNTESYWHLQNVAYKPIIPKHVFLSVGPNGWNTWNPHPPGEAMVTSGPFNVSNYVHGSFCEEARNPHYFYGVPADERTTSPTTSTNETTDGGSGAPWYDWLNRVLGEVNPASLVITAGSIAVIVVVLFRWRREMGHIGLSHAIPNARLDSGDGS